MGWMVLGPIALAPAFVQGVFPARLAISLRDVLLLVYKALKSLSARLVMIIGSSKAKIFYGLIFLLV